MTLFLVMAAMIPLSGTRVTMFSMVEPGADVADGGGGIDQCVAEVTIRCE